MSKDPIEKLFEGLSPEDSHRMAQQVAGTDRPDKPLIVVADPKPPRELQRWEKELLDDARMLKGFRGRRLLACNAIGMIDRVIEHLSADNGADLPPAGGLPSPPSPQQIQELQNMAASLLRNILLWNDGNKSHQKLNRF